MADKFYVTFGFGQPLQNCYAEIPDVASYAEARSKVLEEYQSRWAFIYGPEEALNAEEHKMRKVPFGTPNSGLPICWGCLKRPHQLDEYLKPAEQDGMDVDAYVRAEEGTYNKENGHFLCTSCYIRAGEPSSPRGWVCP
jgi:hypothetical protein